METWFWILGWFLSILTITGNGFIIFLVCSKRQLRTKTNAFVVSLAVADFCLGMIVVPSLFVYEMTTARIYSHTRLPEAISIVRWLFKDVSAVNLCCLVLDRYVAIVKPLQYVTFMTCRRVMQMISFSWGTTFVFIFLQSSFSLSLRLSLIDNIFKWLVVVFFQCLPCFILVFCFISMLRLLYKQHQAERTLAKQLRFNHRVLLKHHENSAVVMMAIVVSLFLVCYGIYLRCTILRISTDLKSCNDYEYKKLLLVLNSAVNPLAYAFFKRDIKKEFKKLIDKGKITK